MDSQQPKERLFTERPGGGWDINFKHKNAYWVLALVLGVPFLVVMIVAICEVS